MRDKSPVLYPDIVRSLFSTMLLEILGMMRGKSRETMSEEYEEAGTPGLHRRRVADSFMRMVENSDGRIRRVDDFAEQLNITPKYLSTLLKETMNRRPSEIIHFYTLKAIERRLRYTDMTMQEIANDLNFPNASFFGKYFKEHAGMTPLDFRRKYYK
jgi:AraC-like DNA-binding protein